MCAYWLTVGVESATFGALEAARLDEGTLRRLLVEGLRLLLTRILALHEASFVICHRNEGFVAAVSLKL